MKKIADGVYLESAYPGVDLGAVILDQCTVMVDAPPRPEDGKAWLNNLRDLNPGAERFLITLDSHPDRSLGARAMESTVVAHQATRDIYNIRPMVFKGLENESGADWEKSGVLNGIRWLTPQIVFSNQARLHGDDGEVLIEHHPGPEEGACWAIVPQAGVAFIGDTVLSRQPPFLANADLPSWIETLDLLLSKEYKEYKLISSRGGNITENVIRSMRRTLKYLHKRLEKLGRHKTKPSELEKLVPKLLAASESPAKYKQSYSERLKYGLFHYYANHYYPISPKSEK